MKRIEDLLHQNKEWSESQRAQDPEFFERLAKNQQPQFLWIGCSDSRVPANEVTGTRPGDIFVHRNVANLVVHTDINLLSVLQYAVEILQVDHVIVCGHYGCGGVRAAMDNKSHGLIDTWLQNIKDTYRLHRDELETFPTEEARARRLAELSVKQQVHNLAGTPVVQRAWKVRKKPFLHGWVYGLEDGIINPLLTLNIDDERLDPIFRYQS